MTQALDDFVKDLYKRKYQSVFNAVLGPNQSGKTDFCLLLMERIEELGLADGFGSNVPLEAKFEVDFIEDFQTLKKACRMLNPDPNKRGMKKYLYFGSEMGKWLPKDQAWRNVRFIEELQTVRKYGLNFLGDGIDRIDERALSKSHFHGVFYKLGKQKQKTAIYNDWLYGRTVTIQKIPRTSIKFDTFYSANFYMEPQGEAGTRIPLNPEHQIVKKYVETGSWKKVGVSTQEGKRAVLKVLKLHLTTCLHELGEESGPPAQIKSDSLKDTPIITE